jgi:hypothetical protein
MHLFGATTPRGQAITGVAVSPDSAQVAVSLRSLTAASKATAHLTVTPTPCHSGGERTWTLHPANFDSQIGSLSWATDGRHLIYIATNTTGGGLTGTPLTLDTHATGSTVLPPPDGGGCDSDEVAGWLGTTGHFAAVYDPCRGRHLQFLVSNTPGQPAIRPVANICDRGSQANSLSATTDGSQILVTCGFNLYLIDSRHLRTLTTPYADTSDAAFAGSAT